MDDIGSDRIQTGIDLLADGAYADAIGILAAELLACRAAGRWHDAAVCLRLIAAGKAELDDAEGTAAACREALVLLGDADSGLAVECGELLGLALAELGRPAEAIGYLRAAASWHAAEGNDEDRAELDEVLAIALADVEDYPQALSLFRRAADDLRVAGRVADAAVCLRRAAAMQVRLHMFAESVETFLHVLTMLGDQMSELALECAEGAAIGMVRLGRHQEAIPLLRRASAGYHRMTAVESAAATDDSLASALSETGAHAEAVEVYRRASAGYLAAENLAEAADSRALGASAAIELDDAALIRAEFGAARDLFERLDGADADIGHCSYVIGVASRELDDRATAEAELHRARTELGADVAAVANCDEQLGMLYADCGRPDAAMDAFTAAAAGYRQVHSHLDLGDCLGRIAGLHADANRPESAVVSLFGAVEAYRAGADFARAAELDVMRGMTLDELGRHDEAIAVCAAVREYYVGLGDELEVAWCDFGIARARVALGRVEGLEAELSRLRRRFLAADDGERCARAELELGRLALHQLDLDGAMRHLEAAFATATAAGVAELATDCRMGQASVLMGSGDYARAIRHAEAARESMGVGPRFDVRIAHCAHVAGMARYCQGRFAEAEVTLLEARLGFERLRDRFNAALVDCHMGVLYLDSGRLDLAASALRRSRTAFETLGNAEAIALVDGNFGNMLMRRNDFAGAEAAFRRAADALEPSSGNANSSFVDPGTLARVDQCIAAAMVLQGNFAAAIVLLRRARAVLARESVMSSMYVAICDRTIALAEAGLGNTDAALAALDAARAANLGYGATVEVAKSDLIGAGIAADGGAAMIDVVARALPAAIFIDAQRFTFAHAASRIAWAELNLACRVSTFEWVHQLGDKTLMADLIETAVNSGTHVAAGTSPDPTGVLRALVDVIGARGDDTEPHTRAAAQPRSGAAAAFIAGAALPMQPPPLLIMPDGRVALRHHVERAAAAYEPIRRPAAITVLEPAP